MGLIKDTSELFGIKGPNIIISFVLKLIIILRFK